MKPENWIAIYAAIVGTAAFVLNFRTWFEKRVRLNLSLMPNAVLIGGCRQKDEKGLMVVTVVNRGGQTTTLTNLAVLRFDSLWKRWRISPSKSYVIANPQVGGTGTIPFELDPGKKWMGAAHSRPDVVPDILDGKYYFAIYATHRDRPYLIQIPKPRSKLPPGTGNTSAIDPLGLAQRPLLARYSSPAAKTPGRGKRASAGFHGT
ncbi:hypothetical protein [Bradyrhizobium sp. LeoA1S1]